MKRYRLTNMELDFISLVKRGDDPSARVVIAKAQPDSGSLYVEEAESKKKKKRRLDESFKFAGIEKKDTNRTFSFLHDRAKKRGAKHSGAWYMTHPNKKSSAKEIVGHHAHKPHGPSILWPALYEHLRAKGMSKEKAARISNAGWNKKKLGVATNTPTSIRGIVKWAESQP